MPYAAGRFKYIGQVGSELTLAEGRDAAVVTALHVLGQIHAARGDIVRLRLQALNSFGAERAFRAEISGHRLVCSNGLVTDASAVAVYARHTSGFCLGRALEKLRRAVEAFLLQEERWRSWAEREIDPADATDVFQAMPGANTRMLARLTELWKAELATLGATVWALYNALTHWSSHDPVPPASEPNRAAIVLGREERVRAALQRPAFRRLIT